MSSNGYQVGMIVTHPNRPEWGPGKVLAAQGNKLVIYFRDLRESKPGEAQKTLSLEYVKPAIEEKQSDPWLDNLLVGSDGVATPKKTRLTIQEGIDTFLSRFPGGFDDDRYLNDPDYGERQYKWEAHQRYVEQLGNGQLDELLAAGQHREIVRRIQSVEAQTNILSVYEKAAFRDALKDEQAASVYLRTLAGLLRAGPTEQACTPYFEAVNSLPADEDKSRVATWPVATIVPYLADPDQFMFLKPQVTKDCAARLNFNLCYDARPNWLTYSKLLTMCHLLMEHLGPLGARDMIDVQSFIWRIENE